MDHEKSESTNETSSIVISDATEAKERAESRDNLSAEENGIPDISTARLVLILGGLWVSNVFVRKVLIKWTNRHPAWSLSRGLG